MANSRIMALKQAKVNREKMKAAKWMAYTSSMLEIKYGEVQVNSITPVITFNNKTTNMHSYRILLDGSRIVKYRTIASLSVIKKRIKTMSGYEYAKVVEIDGCDVNITV